MAFAPSRQSVAEKEGGEGAVHEAPIRAVSRVHLPAFRGRQTEGVRGYCFSSFLLSLEYRYCYDHTRLQKLRPEVFNAEPRTCVDMQTHSQEAKHVPSSVASRYYVVPCIHL